MSLAKHETFDMRKRRRKFNFNFQFSIFKLQRNEQISIVWLDNQCYIHMQSET